MPNSQYVELDDGSGGSFLAKEAGKGAWMLNAEPPTQIRPKRNKAKSKAQKSARKKNRK